VKGSFLMPISFTVNPLDNLTFSGICFFVELVGIFELIGQLLNGFGNIVLDRAV